MASSSELPPNVHVSSHPCLQAKLSQLRSKSTPAKDVKTIVNDIALILGCEALAAQHHQPKAPETILPDPVPVHHLGLYREPSTLEPVEYYNNLPHHIPDPTLTAASTSAAAFASVSTAASTLEAEASGGAANASSLAIILDPVIATGGTCAAAINTLRDWGARRIIVLSVIGAADGVRRAASEWPEATDIWVAGVDAEITAEGMLKPGLGDVGDRLFLTIGK
ncbi:uracil phosphoribosyltransferase [Verticillium alfalfae VaMs.102]|uniref:Uracil phosphoribosyltransferase n=1 Tax=Verticillium alfalfae (strain VaMs.102 / ATCC MYA-4576 / FGSC 10136) TaxID=526221 RepID=C9SP41_VERA1|nr:uracil phosphoribosyltransferase [Verticillium alfalfae VaMs.102]EEY20556.1 uracil phosphoribosyltransferase [Verticillium alfalfae VaMs.102]